MHIPFSIAAKCNSQMFVRIHSLCLKTPSYSNRDELQIKTVIDHDLKDLDDL
jgi:hypothetical protein